VQNVKNFGAFVSLDEYDGKEGFIHITEVATGWVKYIRDYVREGQKIVCKVLAVDPSKEHVDLSLKVINDHQRREKIHLWKDEQKAERLLDMVAQKGGKSAEKQITDEDYDKLIETYGTLYKAFEESVINKKALEEAGFKGLWVADFVAVANENIEPPLVDIAGYLELICYQPDGVNHIKTALSQIEKKMGRDGAEVIVQYIGAPRYRLQVRAKNYKTAEDVITKAADKAIIYITKHNGEGKFAREAKK
jgi:translation initiation factor 2 subunit 1